MYTILGRGSSLGNHYTSGDSRIVEKIKKKKKFHGSKSKVPLGLERLVVVTANAGTGSEFPRSHRDTTWWMHLVVLFLIWQRRDTPTSVHLDFEGSKIKRVGKGGGWERVPVSWTHGDKFICEWSGPTLFQLTAKGCWESENRVLRSKQALGRIYWL